MVKFTQKLSELIAKIEKELEASNETNLYKQGYVAALNESLAIFKEEQRGATPELKEPKKIYYHATLDNSTETTECYTDGGLTFVESDARYYDEFRLATLEDLRDVASNNGGHFIKNIVLEIEEGLYYHDPARYEDEDVKTWYVSY